MLMNVDRTNLAVLFGNAEFEIYETTQEVELEKITQIAMSFGRNHVTKNILSATTEEISEIIKASLGKRMMKKY